MSVLLLGTQSVTRKRSGVVAYGPDGRPTSARTSSTVTASVQPASGRDLEQAGLGDRHRDGIKLYAPTGTFQVADQHAGIASDLITVDGIDYEAQQVKTYALGPMPHDRVLATRVQEVAS